MDRSQLIGAVHLLLIRDHQVLLLRRFNTGYEDGNYSVPAGHMERGESVTSAMIREAEEECGIQIPLRNLAVVGVMHRRADGERMDFFLAASEWAGTLRNTEPHKCDELRWCTIDRLPVNTIPYVKQAIENYQHGQWFAQFGWD